MTTQCPSDLRAIARALGGEVAGGQVLAPGSGHSKSDRSLSIRLSATSPLGFICHSHAGNRFDVCQAHIAEQLGIDPDSWKRDRSREAPSPRPQANQEPVDRSDDAEQRRKARWLWRQHRPIAGSIAEIYLREARGYGGAIPATLGYLPARGGHPHALIAAFGIATEPEPGELAIDDNAVMAVQLVRLKPDGSGKADVEPKKITLGPALGSPIALAPPNDLLGMCITEGLEDGLSVHAATGLGAWANGGSTFMPALAAAVPSYIEAVTVFGDDDRGGPFATDLAARLRLRRFEVTLKFLAKLSS